MKSIASSQFKYTVDLGVKATKMTFKLKKTKKDIITHALDFVLIAVMVAVLIYDIYRDAGFTIDLIILIALVLVEIFNLVMPLIIFHTQKKFLKQLDLANIDYTITEIASNKCTESYYKDSKVVMQNVCDMSKLLTYQISEGYIFAVFSNFACAIFDVNTLTMDLNDFQQYLNNTISKNNLNKTNRKA